MFDEFSPDYVAEQTFLERYMTADEQEEVEKEQAVRDEINEAQVWPSPMCGKPGRTSTGRRPATSGTS